MSIVLVVIGLIIGGILMGNTMIKSAEYRAQVGDIERLNTAINTFKLKYNCLPGDCAQATQLFTGGSQPELVTNGDGDGKISINVVGAYPPGGHPPAGDANANWSHSTTSGGSYAEWTGVFDHLAAAGLWSMKQYNERLNPTVFPDVVCPSIRFKSYGGTSDVVAGVVQGCMTVGYIPGYNWVKEGHKIALGAYGGTGQLGAGTSAGMDPWDAFAVDSKIDDGLGYTGRMVLMDTSYIYRADQTPYCANTSTGVYYNPNNVIIGTGGNPRIRTCVPYYSANF